MRISSPTIRTGRIIMNTKNQQTNWKELKGQIKSKFSKLSDSDIEGLNGHMDQLTSKVQKAYGYDKSRAEQECKTFNKSQEQKMS